MTCKSSGDSGESGESKEDDFSRDACVLISRIGILGDLHGEHDRLARSLEWLHGQQLDALVCTGDIADGRGCINTCCDLLRAGQVLTVSGNHDRWLLEDRVRHIALAHQVSELTCASHEFIASLPRQFSLDTVMGRATVCHGVADNDLARVWPGTAKTRVRRCSELDALLLQNDCRFLFNGHIHYRVVIDFPQLLLLNAGTLKGDSGDISIVDFAAASISAYEITDSGPPVRVCELAIAASNRRVWQDTREFDGTWDPVTLHLRTQG